MLSDGGVGQRCPFCVAQHCFELPPDVVIRPVEAVAGVGAARKKQGVTLCADANVGRNGLVAALFPSLQSMSIIPRPDDLTALRVAAHLDRRDRPASLVASQALHYVVWIDR